MTMTLSSSTITDKLLGSDFSLSKSGEIISEFQYDERAFVYLKHRGKKVAPSLVFDPQFHEFRSSIDPIDGLLIKDRYYINANLTEFPEKGSSAKSKPLRFGFRVAFETIESLQSFISAYILYITSGIERVRAFVAEHYHVENKTTKRSTIQTRIGQANFRAALIEYWERCAALRVFNQAFLRASHIKPWKSSNDAERLDLFNGILLSSNLDLAFDRGYISFAEKGGILISPSLATEERSSLGITKEIRLYKVNRRHEPYLAWHRRNVFKK